MNKTEFISELKNKLGDYPPAETAKSIEYYSEMIDDRIEDGMSEEEAVSSLGSVEDIVSQIKLELPFSALIKKKKRLSTAVIVIIIVLFPLWFALGIAVLSIFISVWAVIFSLWVAGFSIGASAIGCLGASVVSLFTGNFVPSVFALGAAFVLAGITIFFAIGTYYLTTGVARLISLTVRLIKKCIA